MALYSCRKQNSRHALNCTHTHSGVSEQQPLCLVPALCVPYLSQIPNKTEHPTRSNGRKGGFVGAPGLKGSGPTREVRNDDLSRVPKEMVPGSFVPRPTALPLETRQGGEGVKNVQTHTLKSWDEEGCACSSGAMPPT